MRRWLSAFIIMILIGGSLLKPGHVHAASTMFTTVSTQHNTTLALDHNGHIWAWGSNISGNFGDGTLNSSNTPTRITVIDDGAPVSFKEIKPGFDASIALDSNGNLWSTGDNGQGQLGLGSGTASTQVWTKINVTDGGSPVVFKKIASLRYTSIALDSNGKLWVWGFRVWTANNYVPTKQLLMDSDGNEAVFETIEGNEENALAIDSSKHIWNIFHSQYAPTELSVMDGGVEAEFQSISVGAGYGTGTFLCLATDVNGQVWSWGGDDQGQLGDGPASTGAWAPAKIVVMDNGSLVKFIKVAGGNKHVLALDENGEMWTWGHNASGQLGDNTTVNSDAPHKVMVSDNGNPLQFQFLSAGYSVSYGLDASGRLWSWGIKNLLGDNSSGFDTQMTPKKIFIMPQTSLTASVAASTYLQPVTLTASIEGAFGMPTGTVQFKDGGSILGSATLAADGTAQFTTSSLRAGYYNVTAEYGGDDIYLAGDTNSVAIPVTMPDAPFVTITSSIINPVIATVTVQTYGIGNSLAILKWLPGDHDAAAFGSAGNDILAAGSFQTDNNGIYTVYAEDLAGNITLKNITITGNISLPSNSAISPVTAVFDKYTGAAANVDVTTTMTLNGNTLTGIYNGVVPLTMGTDYTVTGSEVVILKTYLQAQSRGTYSLTFTFSSGATQTLIITVSDSTPASSGEGSSSEPNSPPATTEKPPKYTIMVNELSGEVVILVDSSALLTDTAVDGTSVQKLILPEDILNQAANRLKDTKKQAIMIKIFDTERSVQVQLPGSSIAALAETYPSAVIGVKINGSSMELKADVLDLKGLSKRLGVALSELNIVASMEKASDSVYNDLERIGSDIGFRVLGNAVDFQVSAVVNGKMVELRDFGSAYMVRAIVYDAVPANDNVIAVHYDPVTRTVSYIPTHLGSTDNGKKEAVMKAPHYSIYAVIETKDRLFIDMNGHWAKEDVELLASKLIVNGVSADRFAPDDSITRAEFTSLLVRSMGLSLAHDDAYKGFEDVSSTAWYAAEVESAVRAGLIKGITADRFEPNERISREQMAVMIGRALALAINGEEVKGNNQAIDMFTDRDAISSWAKDHVALSVSAGILKGMDDGRFAPADIATRAQAATMLKRFMKEVNFIY